MANQLDLRDLRYFEAIAEAGHLGRAAKVVHRSQPALTGCIRRIESIVGTPLFERVGRGIRLTAAGLALARRARDLRVASDDTVREIAEVGAGVSGHVRVGVLPTLARFLMPPLVRLFLQEVPGVTLRTVIAQNDVLGSHLEAGDVDFIVTTAVRASADIVNHAVLEDEAVVIASRDHPILKKKARLKDLLDYGWVLAPPAVGTRQMIEQVFYSRGLPGPRVQIETNLILMMPTLIRQTDLLTFTSRRHVDLAGAESDLREVPLKETTMRRRFDVVYRRDLYLSPAAQKMIDLLRRRGRALFAGE
ncbi:MAG TPA: LysR family transcriptional regulator [Dehalococcoidia bacterium]|nr:LysR family transcriptional regulator [Dehalococcoidia bacterium]